MDTKHAKHWFTLLAGIIAIAAACILLTSFIWRTFTHSNKKGSFKIDSLERTFIYHVPKHIKPGSRLIIVYHGRKLTSLLMQLFTGYEFDIFADQNQDAIVVYPQGYGKAWNDKLEKVSSPEGECYIDDIAFTEQIIRFFTKQYKTDPDHIYGVGFSNGGEMVMTLANIKPGMFNGIAIISMNKHAGMDTTSNYIQKPVSVIYFSGVHDPIVPHEGGPVMLDGKKYGTVKSAEETLNYWLDVNLCNRSNISTRNFASDKDNERITAIKKDYSSASTGKKVSYIKILDGGHTIPNHRLRIPVRKLGNINKEVDAPELIWEFFMNL